MKMTSIYFTAWYLRSRNQLFPLTGSGAHVSLGCWSGVEGKTHAQVQHRILSGFLLPLVAIEVEMQDLH